MVRAGAGAGHSWVPTARQANQLQLQQTVAMAKQFEMRITFYVFAGVFHLVPAFSTFSTFPLCDFSVFFFSVCVFFIATAAAVWKRSLSLSLSLSIALLNMFTAISCMKYMSFYALAGRPSWAIDPGN